MVNISDIAAHLGVSRLTVSAVLNNRTAEVGIGEKTAARVREAAETLGYYPNRLALAMKTGINPVIGCFVSNLRDEWVGRTLSGFLSVLHEGDYLAKIEEVSGFDKEKVALGRFMEQRVAGIFCCNFNPQQKFVSVLKKTINSGNLPIVHSLSIRPLTGYHVDSDEDQGADLAVKYVRKLGHSRIAFLGGGVGGEARQAGFCRAFEKYDVKNTEDGTGLMGLDLGKVETIVAKWLKDKKRRPTAILCANDAIAAVTIRVARHLGLQVPEQLSVVGFSNSCVCELTDPPLTSIAQPFEEIGRRCGLLLIDQIAAREKKGGSVTLNQELVKTSLVVRGSCGPLKG